MSWQEFFYNPETGLLRSGWRVLVFLVVAIPLFFVLLFALILPLQHLERAPFYLQKLIEVLAVIPAVLAASVWAVRALDRLPVTTLGLTPSLQGVRHLLFGLLWGCAAIGVLIGVLWLAGAAAVHGHPLDGQRLLFSLLVLGGVLLAAVEEEIVFRGYLFQTLLRGIGPLATLLLIPVLFAAFHLGNPNMSPVSFVNILIVGVLFGMLYLRTGTLWMPIGLHAGWNFTQYFFHLPISGFELPFPTPVTATVSGHYLLTGGAFGLEGSVLTSALLLGLLAVVAFTRRGLPLASYWWEWQEYRSWPSPPALWDLQVGSRAYQWKLLPRDNTE